MAITAAQVKQLREMTGAGIMECKKALTETNGDYDAAVEYLRKSGAAKAAKKQSRIAAEGLCYVAQDGDKKASIVEVNSETDFVAKNAKFQAYVQNVANQALKSDAKDMDSFMAEKWIEDPSETVKDSLVALTAVISEKLSIRRFETVSAENGLVSSYVHGGGRIAVIASATCSNVTDEVREALRNVCMQIAALAPKYIRDTEIPQDVRDHEKEILKAQAITENNELPENKRKPEAIIEKMLEGRLKKEFKEICLEDQIYVKAEDGKQTVAQYLAEVGKKNNTTITVDKFVRFETGEGIERKEENFAEEVMSQIKH